MHSSQDYNYAELLKIEIGEKTYEKTYLYAIIFFLFCFTIPKNPCFAIPQIDIEEEQAFNFDKDIFNKDTRWDTTLSDFIYANYCVKDKGILTDQETKKIIKDFSSYVVEEYLSSEIKQYNTLSNEERFAFIINVAQAFINKVATCNDKIQQTYKEEQGSQCAKKLQNTIHFFEEKNYNAIILKEAF